MNNSVFNQFIVVIACFTLLTGAAAISPNSSNNTTAKAGQSQVSPADACQGDEVFDTVSEACVLVLKPGEIADLDKVLSGGITNEDLAARIIADENKPRVDPNSPEEIKKREAEYANSKKPGKSSDTDLNSPKLAVTSYIVISKIKTTAPIVYSNGSDIQNSDWACIGCPMRAKLAKGVLHIAGYPEPGEKGNSVIVGHSSAYASESGSYKTVFAKLNELAPGDTFEVRYSNGKILKYKIFESFEFKLSNAISNNPSAEATAAANKRNNRYGDSSVITLETCWPVGTNKDRWVVQGKLI